MMSDHLPLVIEVAPHVGAWIEIHSLLPNGLTSTVAPHVGAWIEMYIAANKMKERKSHPTWVRGLKYTSDV